VSGRLSLALVALVVVTCAAALADPGRPAMVKRQIGHKTPEARLWAAEQFARERHYAFARGEGGSQHWPDWVEMGCILRGDAYQRDAEGRVYEWNP
jgi:hypothetical protein